MDEKTYEVFMGPDFHFFVAGKDVKFDLEGALKAILYRGGRGRSDLFPDGGEVGDWASLG